MCRLNPSKCFVAMMGGAAGRRGSVSAHELARPPDVASARRQENRRKGFSRKLDRCAGSPWREARRRGSGGSAGICPRRCLFPRLGKKSPRLKDRPLPNRVPGSGSWTDVCRVQGRLRSRHGAAARWVFARVGPPKVDDALRWAQQCTPSSGMIRPTSRPGRPVSLRRRTPSPGAA